MNLVQLLRTTFEEWQKDNASRLAASLAYYTMFSLAPLLIIVIGVAGLVLGQDVAQGQLLVQLTAIVGPDAAKTIESLLANSNLQSASLIATLIGLFTLFMGATGVFSELQASLNQIWHVAPKAATNFGVSVRQMFVNRLVSLVMVLGIGCLLFVTIMISTALAGLANRLLGDETAVLGQAINFALSFCVTTIMFAAIYKVLPDLRIAWRDVWVGALVTALLFSLGRFLIGLYLGLSSGASVFGAAASLVVLLIWIYYSAQIFFFGAEFTQVYARTRGTRQQEEHLLDMPAQNELLPAVAPEIGKEPAKPQPVLSPASAHASRLVRQTDITAKGADKATTNRIGWIAAFAIFGSLIAAGALSAKRISSAPAGTPSTKS